MKDKNVVVTGGAGFLGSHVVIALLEMDNRVTVIDDFSNGKTMHLDDVKDHPALEVTQADICDYQSIRPAFDDAQVVFHFAVLGLRQSLKNPRRVNDVVVNGTINCLEVAKSAGVEVFLNCSTSEVYGTMLVDPMAEDHPLQPTTPYAAAKVAQDMYVRSYGSTYGLPWAAIRPFNMYGPHAHWQGARGELIPRMIVRAMNGHPLIVFGNGEQTRDFVYVEEAAKAAISIADELRCRGNVTNFATGSSVSIRQIAEMICEEMDLNTRDYIQYEPSRPGDVQHMRGSDTRFRSLFGRGAEVQIREGLRKTIQWFYELPFSAEELMKQTTTRNWT
jgi:UDP-glucose 4-epimerase